MNVILLHFGLLPCCLGSQQHHWWWRFDATDCDGNEIRSLKGASVDALKAACLSTPNCTAFNSAGSLKSAGCTAEFASALPVLYVKMSKPQNAADGTPPLWPLPARSSNGTANIALSELSLRTNCDSPTVQSAFARFKADAMPFPPARPASLTVLQVAVVQCNAQLGLGLNESYQLRVEPGAITVAAATQVGFMHALQTLSQLIEFDHDTDQYIVPNAPWVIEDEPRFSHRGLMVDTGRHFVPIRVLKQVVDSISYVKMNVLHWHIVDDQSFALDVAARPLLSRLGAFSKAERYSKYEVADLVHFARERGVRIIVELDNPGHSSSWGRGYPAAVRSDQCRTPLDPSTNASFDLILDILTQLVGNSTSGGQFPDPLIHLGGDETWPECWLSTPSIASWLEENGLTTNSALLRLIQFADQLVQRAGRQPIRYQEVWETFGTGRGISADTIVHYWSSVRRDNFSVPFPIEQVIAEGHQLLWSDMDKWYLSYKPSWQQVYAAEPCLNLTQAQCTAGVLGGEALMWGEFMAGGNLLSLMWPALAAVGERLWSQRRSSMEPEQLDAVAARLKRFRCDVLLSRGVPSAVVGYQPSASILSGPDAPHGPGSCRDQL